MEVHHHPNVEKKNFKGYLFEGLMIFIAVTLGFFAESLREHVGNKSQEREYISSLNEDLKLDTLNLTASISLLQKKITEFDSLVLLLNKNAPDSSEVNEMYFYARSATRKKSFQSSDRTLTELKNSGAFRLLTNTQLTEQIMEYDQRVNYYEVNARNDLQERELLYPFISKIFDANVFQTMVNNRDGIIVKPVGAHTLKTEDKEYINQFIYYVHQVKSSFIVEKKALEDLKKDAASIIQLITQN